MQVKNTRETNPTDAEPLSSTALARRHLLLRGAGKGALLAAAAVPIQTLAGTGMLTGAGKNGEPAVRCSVSGMQSGIHSAAPSAGTCGGRSPGWWKQSPQQPHAQWPASVNPDASITTVCSRSTLQVGGNPATLWQVVSMFSNTDECHWVCAWLNATVGAFNFPYTAAEVIALYEDLSKYDAALTFFKTYMENL